MAMSEYATHRGEQVLIVSAVFTSLATFLTIIRIYARVFLVRQLGADDWTIIVAVVGSKTILSPYLFIVPIY